MTFHKQNPNRPEWTTWEPDEDDVLFGTPALGVIGGVVGVILGFILDATGAVGHAGFSDPSHWVFLVTGLTGLVSGASYFPTALGVYHYANKKYPDIEYRSREHAEAEVLINNLSVDDREDARLAYEAFQRTDPEYSREGFNAAKTLFEQTLQALRSRQHELDADKYTSPAELQAVIEKIKDINSETDLIRRELKS